MFKEVKFSLIIIENVTKKFKENIVLDNISLKFKSGKIYGIIGRNASGKSVLFKIICGFLKPDIGKVEINGIDVYATHSFPKNISALIEKPKFLDELSGVENLLLLSKIKNKISKDDILGILESVGISKSDQNKIFKNYSIGTKQKLGIAQVLMEDDQILIFDEPFNGLDDISVKNIRNLILTEKEKGKLILLASHMKEDIDLLCDEVYKINAGKVTKDEK